MTRPENKRKVKKPRVVLDDEDVRRLAEIHGENSLSMIAKRTGLPYLLVYNVVHGRVKSVSDRHYRMLFGRPALYHQPKKVDGGYFRRMVRLWLFLHDGVSRSDLFREYYDTAHPRKPDYRIFNGQIRMVDAGLERFMRQKFADAGVEGPLLDRWLDEMDELPRDDHVPYQRIEPVLQYLRDQLGLNPATLLNRNVDRYESGDLKRVSRKIYDRALRLKRKVEKVLTGEDHREIDREIERIKESIYGKKPGYTLYLDIREEILFLRKHARRSAKHYLGRSIWTYETGKAKRVADWRARMIIRDCDRFIRERPDLPLSVIPRIWQRKSVVILLTALVGRLVQLLSYENGQNFERRVLSPKHVRSHYQDRYHGLTRFDMAPSVLGMRRKAFDLMVAKNCDIFRSVGIYVNRWYLSDRYLKELSKKDDFHLVSAKYEMLAGKLIRRRSTSTCIL